MKLLKNEQQKSNINAKFCDICKKIMEINMLKIKNIIKLENIVIIQGNIEVYKVQYT